MELLIGLVILGVLGLMLFGVVGIAGFAWIGSGAAKSREQAPDALDGLFDGRDRVTYRVHLRAMPYETVVLGAEERGYSLMHETDERGVKVLIFRLVDASRVSAAPRRTAPAQRQPVDRTAVMLMLLGVGIVAAAIVLVLALPQVAALGYLAIALGLGLAIHGERQRQRLSD